MKDVRKGLEESEISGKEGELRSIADFLGTLSTTTGVGTVENKREEDIADFNTMLEN